MKPQRILQSRRRGARIPDGARSVARPSALGNPFRIGRDGTREECIAKFKRCVAEYSEVREAEWVAAGGKGLDLRGIMRRSPWLMTYRGRDLACFCALDVPCHGDFLLAFINGSPG